MLQQRGSKSDLNELIRLAVECKHYVRPKVYEALFRLLQSTLKARCHFSMPRRVVLRTPTLCDTTQSAIEQTVQGHFSKAPIPLYLQDLCKSIVSIAKRAPDRVCDVVKKGPKPVAPTVVRNALTSVANKPFVAYDVLSIDGKEVGGKLLDLPASVAEKIRQSALTCITRRQCVCQEWMSRYPCLRNDIQHVLFGYPQQWGTVFGDLAAGVMGGHARTACLPTADKVKIQLDQLQSRISSMKLPLSTLNPSPSEPLIGVDIDTLVTDVSKLCARDTAELALKFPNLVGDRVASLSRGIHCAGIVCGVFDKHLHTISGSCRKLVDSHFLLDVIFGPKFGIWGWGTSPRHARVAALREIVTRAKNGGVLEQACSLRLGHPELIEVSQADKY